MSPQWVCRYGLHKEQDIRDEWSFGTRHCARQLETPTLHIRLRKIHHHTWNRRCIDLSQDTPALTQAHLNVSGRANGDVCIMAPKNAPKISSTPRHWTSDMEWHSTSCKTAGRPTLCTTRGGIKPPSTRACKNPLHNRTGHQRLKGLGAPHRPRLLQGPHGSFITIGLPVAVISRQMHRPPLWQQNVSSSN